MAVALGFLSAVAIIVWSARIRHRDGGVRLATIVLMGLALVPSVFLYAAWTANDAWLSEHAGQPSVSPFVVSFLPSAAVGIGTLLVGLEGRRQRRWILMWLCACAEVVVVVTIISEVAIVVLFGLLSQVGSTIGGGWR